MDDPSQSTSAIAPAESAYALLSHDVQEWIWSKKWEQLRPIQVQAIRILMKNDDHALISADTAGGKTEAAFLPIISRIGAEAEGSVRALYIGPLKALINDQFGRLEELCEGVGVPVHRWHGDVGADKKSRLIAEPGGILLITPESLESLFVNRSTALPHVFGGLRFVVIDELHAFLGDDRGMHLSSLLCRLRALLPEHGRGLRFAGLSATLGDTAAAARFLDPDEPSRVRLVVDPGGGAAALLRLHGYAVERPRREEAPDAQWIPGSDPPESDLTTERRIARDITDHCLGATNLVFANARRDVEVFADLCTEIASKEGYLDAFLAHHGSLSREIREDAESAMKRGVRVTTFCSSTLEMGIDIGHVRLVGQVGAPWSAASLKQRLGRSGRKESEPRRMRLYIRCAPLSEDDPVRRLEPELLQAIAGVELMLEKWSEPLQPATCDLSTLTQQVISVIAQTGGVRADHLYDILCVRGAFRSVEPVLFARLLRSLGQADIVEQMGTGDLILGLAGEKIRASRDFYAVFRTSAEYRVINGARQLGTLPLLGVPDEGDHLIFAARRWQVASIDHDRHELQVVPAVGRKPPIFQGGLGFVHRRVREKMCAVLADSSEPPYIDGEAREALARARKSANESGGHKRCLVRMSDSRTLWFTWTGTREQMTLAAMLLGRGVAADNKHIALLVHTGIDDARAHLRALGEAEADQRGVAAMILPRVQRKYDGHLAEDLQIEGLARDTVDLDGAKACIEQTLGTMSREG